MLQCPSAICAQAWVGLHAPEEAGVGTVAPLVLQGGVKNGHVAFGELIVLE